MINASDALKQSKQYINDIMASELADVENAIVNVIDRGEVYCYFYAGLHMSTIEKIKSLGYSVEDHSSQKDGITYKISWEDAIQ